MIKTVLTTCFLLVAVCSAQADEHVFHHEHVLGTNLDLRIETESAGKATEVESRILEEIDRLSKILSRHDKKSELSHWQASPAGSEIAISEELKDVFQRAEHWRNVTAGAFDVRSAELSELWKKSIGQISVSADASRHELIRQLSQAPYLLRGNKAIRNDNNSISLDALAKGYILDRVTALAKQDSTVTGFVVNIGGDIRKFGDASLPVSILDPESAHEGGKPLSTIQITGNQSVATSGGYFRGEKDGGKNYSHIFDPRTGLPVEVTSSVTILADNAMDADALATAVSVLGGERGLALIESIARTECMILSTNGSVFRSSGWPQQDGEKKTETKKESKETETKKDKSGIVLKFKLNRPKGKRYRRPYVAAWLEDKDGFPVKTALLFMQTENPGPRWHRDLTRWYRNDRQRKMVEKSDLIGTISGATRGPGEYSAIFDGTDNLGEKLASGAYTLCLEVAREHGTYQLIREKLNWDPSVAIPAKELEENIEVSEVSYAYEIESAKASDATETETESKNAEATQKSSE